MIHIDYNYNIDIIIINTIVINNMAISTDDVDFVKLLNLKRSQVRMMTDRGFDTTNEVGIQSASLDTFKTHYIGLATKNNLDIRGALSFIYYNSATKARAYVHYTELKTPGSQYGKSAVENIMHMATKFGVTHIILITHLTISPMAKTTLNSDIDMHVQIFDDRELSTPLIDHDMVPKQYCLTPEEEYAFLNTFKHTKSSLPTIPLKDAIVKYYDWPSGGIVVTIRKGVPGVERIDPVSIYYRVIR